MDGRVGGEGTRRIFVTLSAGVLLPIAGFVFSQLSDAQAAARYAWARATRVEIRSAPNEKHGVVGVVSRGTRFQVTEEADGWLHVIPPSYDIRSLPDGFRRKDPATFQAGWIVGTTASQTEIFDEATALQVFQDWIEELRRDPMMKEGSFAGIRLIPLAALWASNETLEFDLGVGLEGEVETQILSVLGQWTYLMLGARFFSVFQEARAVELRLVARVWGVDSSGVMGARYEPIVKIRTTQDDARRIRWEEALAKPQVDTKLFSYFWQRENATLTTR
ncbi:MAG: SH3 domain-containing protein [Nitrospirae bacterium]|nr:SH3 domain-containing protein [Nitrospirota bacterium]